MQKITTVKKLCTSKVRMCIISRWLIGLRGLLKRLCLKFHLKCKTKFLTCPYFIDIQLWNELSKDIQCLDNVLNFGRSIAPVYKVYQEPNV